MSIALPILVVPLASNHSQVGAGNGPHICNHVVAAVDVAEILVERYIKHCQLVVVAEKTLQESKIAECEAAEVVILAVDEYHVGAT